MTVPERLQQLDQDIIRLLNERIAVLSSLHDAHALPTVEEQAEAVKPLLTNRASPEFQLSESDWRIVLVTCMASLATTPPVAQQATTQPRKVTVVGGRGVMGSFFVKRFQLAGHHVSVMEAEDWDRADELLGGADLVILAVPLKAIVPIALRVGPYLSDRTLLVDVASTKVDAVKAMMESHSGPVLGLHPMFGPGPSSFLGQKVIICPGREPEQFSWVLEVIENDGGTILESTPEEHDTIMVMVQAIRFFSNFSLGTFFAHEGLAFERSLEFSSPLYRTEINNISRLVGQEPTLYVDILLASEERSHAIQRMVEMFSRLAGMVATGDREGLIQEFEHTRQSYRHIRERSLRESAYSLDNLIRFIATDHIEQSQRPPEPLMGAPVPVLNPA